MRERDAPDVGSSATSTPAIRSARSLDRWFDWTSLDTLTESILRRIMRVACAVGTVGMAAAVLGPQPYNPTAMGIAVGATLVIFAMTFVPVKVRILSVVYPSALVVVGGVLSSITGPRADSLLLIAGGIFIGSFVLRTTGLVLLSVTAVAVVGVGMVAQLETVEPELLEVWTSSASSMAAVILPAAMAGRMLVAALASTLAAREALVAEVVADRRKLEEMVVALEKTRTQLTHAQKLEVISQMAGGIAHDMNNALTAVIGEASLLDDAVAEERERIIEAGAYAAKLTQQLMVFGRRDTSQPRPIDLGATLVSLHQSIRRMMPSDINVDTDVPAEAIAVVADPTQLLQVVLNLAANAKDAMDGGGEFLVRLRADAAAERAVLEVSDTGSGMSDETLARVFEPFFTTKPPGQGTGLGLANVKQLVEGMAGSVSIRSRVGRGTTFVIHLPTTTSRIVVDKPDERASRSIKGTILVVDDDVRVRAVAFTALQRQGHQVFEAPSIQAAVETVRANQGRIDLLLTDVVMAGGGGAQTIEAVRREVPEIAVLVMSGYADDEALRRGIARGEYPFIAKPFTSEVLTAAVERALAGRSRVEHSTPTASTSSSLTA